MNDKIKYQVIKTSRFKKNYKLIKKQGKDLSVLAWGINQLARDIPLPVHWKDHQLKGNLKKYRECHIDGAGDWLLMYEKRNNEMVISLVGTGNHVELLGL